MERSEVYYNQDVTTPNGNGVVWGFLPDGRVLVYLKEPTGLKKAQPHTKEYWPKDLSKPIVRQRIRIRA